MSDWAVLAMIGLVLTYKGFTHWLDSRHVGRETDIYSQSERSMQDDGYEDRIGFTREPR